ncbi:LytR/AlgR family response regulator transcription factor [Alteromonas facilis]|uniref:LytR/AlgR family response regulator transcription factor n=1 Tax=Alteromonas facilis TaxID=2048004 RepID=UPI000C291371|nr:LytTR family DNA-binding domain-containing protein [Alteromonas facilis]
MDKHENSQEVSAEGQAVAQRDGHSGWTGWLLRVSKQRPKRFFVLLFFIYIFINNSITASSVWMEATRDGVTSLSLWEPFVWEYSSMLTNIMLIPLLLILWERFPLRFANPGRQVAIHVCISLCYALLHVVGMVLMREGAYWLAGGNYDFGDWVREFFYEYRKDVWGYLVLILMYHMFMALYKRIQGEADFIDEPNDDSGSRLPSHLLVRKLDKEFLVKVSDVEWLESSGNYVNLHVKGRIYPLRTTMKEIASRFDSEFTRVHRSIAVSHNAVAHISYQSSGDGTITMTSGEQLPLSRRYKEQFKQKLSVSV